MEEFLKQIIRHAGQISLDYRRRLKQIAVSRKSAKDFVTEADVVIEQYLVEQIRKQFPDHTIYGEESGMHAGSGWRWIIDPIDGTGSFMHDQPFYSISIGIECDGKLIYGAVHMPAMGELFFARAGGGAFCNDLPIRVSACDNLADAMLATGFACMRMDLAHNNLKYVNRLLPKIRDLRRTGSAALDLCYVACGRFDGYWELNLKPFDIAAGRLIVQQAGGIVSDFSGGEQKLPHETLAANPALYPLLLKELND